MDLEKSQLEVEIAMRGLLVGVFGLAIGMASQARASVVLLIFNTLMEKA